MREISPILKWTASLNGFSHCQNQVFQTLSSTTTYPATLLSIRIIFVMLCGIERRLLFRLLWRRLFKFRTSAVKVSLEVLLGPRFYSILDTDLLLISVRFISIAHQADMACALLSASLWLTFGILSVILILLSWSTSDVSSLRWYPMELFPS